MPKFRKKKLIIIAIILSVTLACGISFNSTDNETEMLKLKLTQQSMTMTQSALSIDSSQDESEDQEQAEDQSQDEEIDEEEDSEPEEPEIPCNKAKFIAEAIADDTEFNPGETFTQTWTMRNDGTCTWDGNYRVVFNEGDRMNGESSYHLAEEVEPGDTIKLSVHLTAPATSGQYKGYWNIKAPDGDLFTYFWSQIVVVAQNIHTIYYKNNGPDTLTVFSIVDVGIGQATHIAPGNTNEYMNFDRTAGFPPGTYTIRYEWTTTAQIEKQVNIHTDGQTIVLTP